MSKHKQTGGIWTAQSAHCALDSIRNSCDVLIFKLTSTMKGWKSGDSAA